VTGVGKIGDIYDRRGISEDVHTEGNADGLWEGDALALTADLGATVAEYFGLAAAEGRSFLGDAAAHP